MGTLLNISYYINFTDEINIDAFNLEMEEKFDGSINTAINVDAIIKVSAGVYSSLMTIMDLSSFLCKFLKKYFGEEILPSLIPRYYFKLIC